MLRIMHLVVLNYLAVAQWYACYCTDEKAGLFHLGIAEVVLLPQDVIEAVLQLQDVIRDRGVGVRHCLLLVNLLVQVLDH